MGYYEKAKLRTLKITIFYNVCTNTKNYYILQRVRKIIKQGAFLKLTTSLIVPFITMGGFDFERPVGANADVMELEYISALHQTDDANREEFMNGSIVCTCILFAFGTITFANLIKTVPS